MKKLLEKEIYETPSIMEISPVSFVAVQGESGGPETVADDSAEGGGMGDLGGGGD